MVTNYLYQLTATATIAGKTTQDRSMAERLATRAGRFVCGLRGHDSVLHFEEHKVMMRCTSCGFDTPGWELSPRRPRPRFAGDARRHELAQPRLMLRKTA